MSELTDFLLARIAEDEATGRAVRDGDVQRLWDLGYQTFDTIGAATMTIGSPARMLAELEGKRLLVEGVREFQEGGSWTWTRPDWFRSDSKWHNDTPYVLRCLSTAYADHPDYQQEWKP